VGATLVVFMIGMSASQYPGMRLVWNDEFDGPGIDNSKWQHEVNCWGGGNNELQCYTDRPTNSRIINGSLVLTARVEQLTGSYFKCTDNTQNSCIWQKDYTSARLRSLYDPLGSWTYGRFEVRAKLPKGKHLWPAIWMLPSDYDYGVWPSSGEIDIMEARGQETDIVSSALHFGPAWPDNQHITTGKIKFPIDFSADYHIFSVEWEENEMRFYVDDQKTWTVDTNRMWYSGTKGVNPYTANGQPWNKRFHMIMNLAIGGAFFDSSYGTLTKTEARNWQSPSLYVDYVRVYQKSTAVCGDGACTEDETSSSCPSDCKDPDTTTDNTETQEPTTPSETTNSEPTNPEPTNPEPTNPSTGEDPITDPTNGAANNGDEFVEKSGNTNVSALEGEVTGHKHAIQALAILSAVFGVAIVAGVVSLVILTKKMRQMQGYAGAPVSPSDNNMALNNFK